MFHVQLETRLYYLSITIVITDTSPARMAVAGHIWGVAGHENEICSK